MHIYTCMSFTCAYAYTHTQLCLHRFHILAASCHSWPRTCATKGLIYLLLRCILIPPDGQVRSVMHACMHA